MAKLWLISQTKVQDWDTYDSAVVVAETEDDARNTHPGRGTLAERFDAGLSRLYPDWATDPSDVTAEYLGETDLEVGRVVCASFNAG